MKPQIDFCGDRDDNNPKKRFEQGSELKSKADCRHLVLYRLGLRDGFRQCKQQARGC
jgi:hypothetical protein